MKEQPHAIGILEGGHNALNLNLTPDQERLLAVLSEEDKLTQLKEWGLKDEQDEEDNNLLAQGQEILEDSAQAIPQAIPQAENAVRDEPRKTTEVLETPVDKLVKPEETVESTPSTAIVEQRKNPRGDLEKQIQTIRRKENMNETQKIRNFSEAQKKYIDASAEKNPVQNEVIRIKKENVLSSIKDEALKARTEMYQQAQEHYTAQDRYYLNAVELRKKGQIKQAKALEMKAVEEKALGDKIYNQADADYEVAQYKKKIDTYVAPKPVAEKPKGFFSKVKGWFGRGK